jgi:hypothetical protein
MGFFKAERDLVKQARQMRASQPSIKETMAGAQERIEQATQAMAAQAQAADMASTLGANGIPVSISVVSATQTGVFNFNAMLEIEAMVMPDGQPPYQARIPLTISQLQAPLIQPGKTFTGKAAPDNRETIWIDPTSIR